MAKAKTKQGQSVALPTKPKKSLGPAVERPTPDPFDQRRYDRTKKRLLEFMKDHFLNCTRSGALPAFSPAHLLQSPDPGFGDNDKADLRLALTEFEHDRVLSGGFIEMPTSRETARTYDPWFVGRSCLTVLPKVLAAFESQNPSGKSPKKPGRKLKQTDPMESQIREVYAEIRNVKATVERLKLTSLGKLTAMKRVERIVTRDRKAVSRGKKQA